MPRKAKKSQQTYRYPREEMIRIRGLPLSAKRPTNLSKEFDNEDGFFSPDKWLQYQWQCQGVESRNNRQKRTASKKESDNGTNPSVLSPQRKGFSAGCRAPSPTTTDDDKAAKSRWRHGQQQINGVDFKPAFQKNALDTQTNLWRGLKPWGDKSFNDGRTDSIPEWLDEGPVSMTDVIELRGFEDELVREAKKQQQNAKEESSNNGPQKDSHSESASGNLDQSAEANAPITSTPLESTPIATASSGTDSASFSTDVEFATRLGILDLSDIQKSWGSYSVVDSSTNQPSSSRLSRFFDNNTSAIHASNPESRMQYGRRTPDTQFDVSRFSPNRITSPALMSEHHQFMLQQLNFAIARGDLVTAQAIRARMLSMGAIQQQAAAYGGHAGDSGTSASHPVLRELFAGASRQHNTQLPGRGLTVEEIEREHIRRVTPTSVGFTQQQSSGAFDTSNIAQHNYPAQFAQRNNFGTIPTTSFDSPTSVPVNRFSPNRIASSALMFEHQQLMLQQLNFAIARGDMVTAQAIRARMLSMGAIQQQAAAYGGHAGDSGTSASHPVLRELFAGASRQHNTQLPGHGLTVEEIEREHIRRVTPISVGFTQQQSSRAFDTSNIAQHIYSTQLAQRNPFGTIPTTSFDPPTSMPVNRGTQPPPSSYQRAVMGRDSPNSGFYSAF